MGDAGKRCVICGRDCSGRPRVKDPRGRYYCRRCHEQAAARRGSGAPPPPPDLPPEVFEDLPEVPEPPAAAGRGQDVRAGRGHGTPDESKPAAGRGGTLGAAAGRAWPLVVGGLSIALACAGLWRSLGTASALAGKDITELAQEVGVERPRSAAEIVEGMEDYKQQPPPASDAEARDRAQEVMRDTGELFEATLREGGGPDFHAMRMRRLRIARGVSVTLFLIAAALAAYLLAGATGLALRQQRALPHLQLWAVLDIIAFGTCLFSSGCSNAAASALGGGGTSLLEQPSRLLSMVLLSGGFPVWPAFLFIWLRRPDVMEQAGEWR